MIISATRSTREEVTIDNATIAAVAIEAIYNAYGLNQNQFIDAKGNLVEERDRFGLGGYSSVVLREATDEEKMALSVIRQIREHYKFYF